MIAAELSRDAAVREADTLLLTVPNQLGVEYNARLLETFALHIAPAIGDGEEPEPTAPVARPLVSPREARTTHGLFLAWPWASGRRSSFMSIWKAPSDRRRCSKSRVATASGFPPIRPRSCNGSFSSLT